MLSMTQPLYLASNIFVDFMAHFKVQKIFLQKALISRLCGAQAEQKFGKTGRVE